MASRFPEEQKLKAHYSKNLTYHSTNVREILNYMGYNTLPPVSSVLDLGCGDGRASFILFNMYPKDNTKIVGVDYCQERIDFANTKAGDCTNIRFECADIHDFLDRCIKHNKTFDLAIANEVLEHLVAPHKVIDKLKQVSRWILGTVPLNMPYVAHLSVWETIHDVRRTFQEFQLCQMGENIVLEWKKGQTEVPVLRRRRKIWYPTKPK